MSLHLQPTDNGFETTGKVLGRITVGILTLGADERYHYIVRSIEKWVGKTSYELRSGYGQPTEIISNGAGEETWVYVEQRVDFNPGITDFGAFPMRNGGIISTGIYIPPSTTVRKVYRRFVLRGGVVQSYSWDGF